MIIRLFSLTTTDRFWSNWACIPRWASAFCELKAITSSLSIDLWLDKNLTIEWHRLQEPSKNTIVSADRSVDELFMSILFVCMTIPPDF